MMSPRDYDEAITIFSPEGRLYQVEYALELVKRGAPIVGMMSPDGVVLAANETVESPLQDSQHSWKIFQIDEHCGTAIAGLSSDARVLIGRARRLSQQNRLLYEETIDIEALARNIGDQAQIYTQYGGVRPYGVSMILGGVDKTGPKLITTDPAGSYRGFKATAVGRKSEEANKLLEEQYRDDIPLGEAIGLAVEAVRAASEGELTPSAVKVSVIPTETRTFRLLTDEEIKKYF